VEPDEAVGLLINAKVHVALQAKRPAPALAALHLADLWQLGNLLGQVVNVVIPHKVTDMASSSRVTACNKQLFYCT
jgi:hypothetical protein